MSASHLRAEPTFRAVWGLVLLLLPGPLLQLATGRSDSRSSRGVVRVLGGRQVLQAAFGSRHQDPAARNISMAVDALHALSMVALALASPRWRRAGAIDAGIAGILLATTARSGHRQAT